MKKFLALVLVVALVLFGCGQAEPLPETTAQPEKGETVGLCLPGRGADWSAHATKITAALEAEGIRVFTEYAAGDVLLQQDQVRVMVNMPVDLLIVGAVDPLALGEILEGAAMPVLAYDRLPSFSGAVSALVAPDYYGAGQKIATYALEQYSMEDRKTPLTVELLMGQPQDTGALRFYEGVMSVLSPGLESGQLECRSGRLRFEDAALEQADMEEARDICFDYLAREYENAFPDIFIAGNDAMAEGCIAALEGMAFSPSESWPVVNGLGGSEEARLWIEDGYQTATAVVDEDALTAQCVSWALALLEGTLRSDEKVSNGAVEVPCKLIGMEIVHS